MAEEIEIRWHGRGGQGLVTASKILAEAAILEGKHSQGLPEYGPERMGAPVRSFVKISNEPIRTYCQVTEPHMVVVLDPSLLDTINVIEGLKNDGILLVNTPLSPDELRSRLGYRGKIYTVNATSISIKTTGRNFPNIPVLRAIPSILGINKENLVKGISSKFEKILSQKALEANLEAWEKAYERVRGS